METSFSDPRAVSAQNVRAVVSQDSGIMNSRKTKASGSEDDRPQPIDHETRRKFSTAFSSSVGLRMTKEARTVCRWAERNEQSVSARDCVPCFAQQGNFLSFFYREFLWWMCFFLTINVG